MIVKISKGDASIVKQLRTRLKARETPQGLRPA